MMTVGEYTLVNDEKISRVLDGTTNAKGEMLQGLGDSADESLVLAHYDKIGGLILGKQGATVKTGSFWDFKSKKPFEVPQVSYVFRINGDVAEVEDSDTIPMEVQAAVKVSKRKKK